MSRSELRVIQFSWEKDGDVQMLRRINITLRNGEQLSLYALSAAIGRIVADKRAFARLVSLVGEVRSSGKTANWEKLIDMSMSTAGPSGTIAEIRFPG
jgi:hypothetical protein